MQKNRNTYIYTYIQIHIHTHTRPDFVYMLHVKYVHTHIVSHLARGSDRSRGEERTFMAFLAAMAQKPWWGFDSLFEILGWLEQHLGASLGIEVQATKA